MMSGKLGIAEDSTLLKKHNSYLDINWDPYTLMHFFHTLLIIGEKK